MKTKTYVLTLSTRFPKGHPREGEDTRFADKLRGGIHYGPRLGDDNARLLFKLHTIRANYDLWKKRIDEVNAGKAVLSVRQWLGKPRRSKQREIFRFDKDSGIGVERLEMDGPEFETRNPVSDPYEIDDDPIFLHYNNIFRNADDEKCGYVAEDRELARNDGLTLDDWLAWFRDYDHTQPMAIIHFTKFRYCK